MKNKILFIILAITGGIALLALVFYGGILLQTQKAAPQLEKASRLRELTESKVILPIMTSGKVTDISDRTITLSSQGESLTIPIREEAEIISFIFPGTEEGPITSIRKEIKFEDIKVGDNSNISLEILEDGRFEGVSVLIFPPFETETLSK